MRFTSPRAFVPHVSPKPRGFGFAGTRVKQLDRRIISKDGLSVQNMPPDGIGQRLQQVRGFANPIGQCGTIKIDALALEDLRLPIERRVVRILKRAGKLLAMFRRVVGDLRR